MVTTAGAFSLPTRVLVVVLLLAIGGCQGLRPPKKYDVSNGLDVIGKGTGSAGFNADGAQMQRAARAAALMTALANWCEEFDDLRRDIAGAEDELPDELYDPDAPPPVLSNLTPYQEDFETAARLLRAELQATGTDGSKLHAREQRSTCTLRPGVVFTYSGRWDEFGLQVRDECTLTIDATSDYFQPVTLRSSGTVLALVEEEVIPLEYIIGLLGGHEIEVTLRDRPDGSASAELSRHWPPRK